MSLLNNKYITLYRDIELEAFYDVESKYRIRIIIAHAMIHLLPVLLITLIYWFYPEKTYTIWLLGCSIFFYLFTIIETTSYLFPSSRERYKKIFVWVIMPVVLILGAYVGYKVGGQIFEESTEVGENLLQNFAWIIIGVIGTIGLFVWAHIGLAQILKASRVLYTRAAEVEADVRFATEVQNRILKEVSISHNSVRAYANSIAANELGGDYFELSRHDDTLFASIGDVSGHSFGAGLLMTMTKSALQTHLEYNHDPAQIMKALNRLFLKQSDRAMYATMVLIKLNLSTHKVELCNAGHVPVLHYIAASGKLETRHKKGIGLGLTDKAEYTNLEFSLQKGDLLFLYSDGLIETRNQDREIRDADFFEKIIYQTLKQPTEDPKILTQKIIREVEESDYSEKFEDDATLIVVSN